MPRSNPMADFERQVNYSITTDHSGQLLLRATLKDCLHDIHVETVVDPTTMMISTAQACFKCAPSTFCIDVAPQVDRLRGLVIGPGMNRALTALFSGNDGCGNLRMLFSGLLPLAINARAAAGFDNERDALDAIHSRLVGTCAGYPRKSPPAA